MESKQYLTITGGLELGSMQADNGATLVVFGSMTVDGLSCFLSQLTGAVEITGNLLGNTQNADRYDPTGTTYLGLSGSATNPQLLEVMSQDLGTNASGFTDNFAYGTLVPGRGAGSSSTGYVKLVDQSVNAPGTGSEALYTDSLVVSPGTTLDLNGLHLYTRAAQIYGTVVGGSIIQIPSGGALSLSSPTPGSISTPGQLDEWTFYGMAGHCITAFVDTGVNSPTPPLSPCLDYARVRLLDANNDVLATANNGNYGYVVTLTDVALPADGTYRIEVDAPSGPGTRRARATTLSRPGTSPRLSPPLP